MASIKLKHPTGNSTIIHSPAANPSSDVTLKLPSTSGSACQVLKVASANHSATNAELEFAGGGKILKVTDSITSTATTINATTTYTDTGLSHSITTTAANSKILVLGRLAFLTTRNGTDAGARFRVVRTISGSDTNFFEGGTTNEGVNIGTGSYSNLYGVLPITFYDSTLSSIASGTTITYKLQGRTASTGLSDQLQINTSDRVSTLILQEVGA